MIPRLLHRVVPEVVPDESRGFWQRFKEQNPDWVLITHQDPLDPAEWPLTAHRWGACTSGAQLAGLVRLEALWRWGGIYVDQDVEPVRPLEPLRSFRAFAAWEDANVIPDAVLGAEPDHPAIRRCLDLALERIELGPWASGPGVTTEVLANRDDVTVLGPCAFYPYHYTQKHRRGEDFSLVPECIVVHHWHGSWLDG